MMRVSTEDEMIDAGVRVAETLSEGDVVALVGQLGAGKTHFSKGIVAGLGSDDPVTSPTFSLVNEYRSGSVPVYHFDFYRLESDEELIQLGWDEYLEDDAIVLVEWADKFDYLLPTASIWFEISVEADGEHLVRRK